MSDHDSERYTWYVEWERPYQADDYFIGDLRTGSGTINVVALTIEEAVAGARAAFVNDIKIKAVTRSPRPT